MRSRQQAHISHPNDRLILMIRPCSRVPNMCRNASRHMRRDPTRLISMMRALSTSEESRQYPIGHGCVVDQSVQVAAVRPSRGLVRRTPLPWSRYQCLATNQDRVSLACSTRSASSSALGLHMLQKWPLRTLLPEACRLMAKPSPRLPPVTSTHFCSVHSDPMFLANQRGGDGRYSE